MKRIWTGILLAAALSAPALAADLPTKAPAVFAPAPVANWTGFYVGINGGGGILNGDIMDNECFLCADITMHKGFGTIGGQLGYNWQMGSFVVGAEGDLNWVSASQSRPFASDDGSNAGTATLKMDAFGSVRARMGLAVDRTLIYVTGGPVWGHFKSSVVEGGVNSPTILGTATDDNWRLGLAAGAGVEYMVTNNWIVRGEYLFLDFTDNQATVAFNNTTTCSSGSPCHFSFGNTASVVRVGLSYKFQ